MKEQEILLKSYRKEIEVLVLTMEVPTYDYNDERRQWFPKYEDVLLKFFNNMRDDRSILRIENYYDSNEITLIVNLTRYLEESYSNREECIKHLKEWFKSGCDIADEDVKVEIGKAYLYEVPEYRNKIVSFENETYIRNFIDWED